MTVRSRFFATSHAVRQFVRRVRPDLSFVHARDELLRLAEGAHVVRPARNGCVLMRTPAPERLRLIVGPGQGPLPAIVTVETRCDEDARRC